MGTRIGAAAWGFRDLMLEDQLIICNKLGFSCLELGIANACNDIPLDVTDVALKEVVELYQKYGIHLVCAATGNDFTLSNLYEIKENVDKVKRVIDICESIGVLFLRIFAGFSPVEEVIGERWEHMVLALNEVADYARERNVTIAIETHGGVNGFEDGVEHFASVSTKPDALKKLLMELNDNVMFVFDPANLAAAGEKDIRIQYGLLKERIAYMHVKNFKLLSSGRLDPATAEEGIFDWKKFFEQCGVCDVDYVVEYEKTESIEQGSKECIKSLRKWGIKE